MIYSWRTQNKSQVKIIAIMTMLFFMTTFV